MKITVRKNPLQKYIILLVSCLLLLPQIVSATDSKEDQAPGLSMAQQATKSKEHWVTTDHSKHEILQKDFKSGAEVTQACISCHSEAETQFHKTIHWTWLADPTDTDRQYGKAGNSLNNYCISTNKTKDAGCLACHPGPHQLQRRLAEGLKRRDVPATPGFHYKARATCLACHLEQQFTKKGTPVLMASAKTCAGCHPGRQKLLQDWKTDLETGIKDTVEVQKEALDALSAAKAKLAKP